MRRLWAILVLLAVAALGSGALRHAHDRAHAIADAQCHHGEASEPGHESPAHAPVHDESNCFIHAVLKLPMIGAGHVPVLVFAGLFVAFLTSLPAPAVLCRRPVLLLNSRGPPLA